MKIYISSSVLVHYQ